VSFAVVIAATVGGRDAAPVTPADAFRRSLDADPQKRSAMSIRRVPVPDLVGQPLSAAREFVASVPRARLSVGGDGPVVVFQHPAAGGLLSDDGAFLAVTLGSQDQLAQAREPNGEAAQRTRRGATEAYPAARNPAAGGARPGSDVDEARDPTNTAVTSPTSYASIVVVVTYATDVEHGPDWAWRLVDTRSASVLTSSPVRPGEGCSAPDRQRLVARLSSPVPPDHEITVRLDRRVGAQDERQAASTLPAAATYRDQGVVIFRNGGRLATSPTGDSKC